MTDDLHGLPSVASAVASVLGRGAAMRLSEALGGQAVKVPKRAPRSALAKRVGVDIARVLAAEYGGLTISIPNLGGRSSAVRDYVKTHPRESANAVARELGVTERQVRRVRARLRDGAFTPTPGIAPAQLSLFEC